MMELLKLANKLEDILTNYVGCHYGDFKSFKANNDLLNGDWNSSINFALGFLYARNEELKKEINNFLWYVLEGKNIEDVVYKEYDQVDESEKEKKYQENVKKVEEIINKLEILLKKDKYYDSNSY